METVAAKQPEYPEEGTVPLLELRDIKKRYGALEALKGVSLHVKRAEILALLGDNGAGKSTLVKIISGVVPPDAGSMFWEGRPVTLKSHAEATALGIETIYQDSALVDSLTVARNIFLGRELVGPFGFMHHRKMRAIASDVLQTIVAIEGIDSPDKLVGSLSGGQKQAVAIARAVYFKRTLLVLDEPTSALAVRATEALFEYLRTLRSQGLSSILVTHNLYDAYRICDRFIILSHGELVFEASRSETSVAELTERVSRS
ncbi:ABC transporter ATP-binding protein [Thermogemmatispora tikiterensis]|uniref:ABC transporter ATP-binding protein n=2 Tax=Thermogemmatispora tikiterensis TaxID=1825093 RepID=A0A328VL63_9CHLR|nr:ABC transporter ATP-binding protein [Thermogemmatispora tikiterensis]